MDRRKALGWAGIALGVAYVVMGAAHSVAVTQRAFERYGADPEGLDYPEERITARWLVLLALGFAIMAGAGTLAAASWRILRGSRPALWVALGAAAFMAVETGIVAAVFSPGPVALFAAYLVLWWLVGRPLTRADS